MTSNSSKLEILKGHPYPLGSTITEHGINFSAFSENADSFQIVIFLERAQEPSHIFSLDPDKNRSENIWHVEIRGLPAQFEYGYRTGQFEDKQNYLDLFNPHRILNDPYARAFSGGEVFGKTVYQVANQSSRRSLVHLNDFNWENDQPPDIPFSDSIIYEMHVRGYTKHSSAKVSYPGSFKGLIEKIPYLQSLGITAIELLPITEFDENLIDRRNPLSGKHLYNYWGYDPLGYFAPKASYAANNHFGQQVNEFKSLVKEMHRAGIEVILDVVFNHTGEGPRDKPPFSFRGLDNQVYYMQDSRSGQYYNFTGCGNTLNCNHPVVSKMIVEALCYWVTEMHVDGFRFDLASILCRAEDGKFLLNPPVVEAISLHPVLSKVKLIAEAWDAAGLYLVGSFPGGKIWAEWNDKYRDTIRRYTRGDRGLIPELATRIAGSSDLFGSNGRTPDKSINFITSHDGFTMYDLVSYSQKHNLENGENNHDGLSENFSADQGIEGDTEDENITILRHRQIKNMATLLFLSQGVPMIVAGDEFGRTQKGNNNAYCQDNEISWVNWNLCSENAGLLRFFKVLIKFRKDHPSLRRKSFFKNDHSGNVAIQWYNENLKEPDWNNDKNLSLAFHLFGTANDSDIFVVTHNKSTNQKFVLPEPGKGTAWYRVIDTSHNEPYDIYEKGLEPLLNDQNIYEIHTRSSVVLISK